MIKSTGPIECVIHSAFLSFTKLCISAKFHPMKEGEIMVFAHWEVLKTASNCGRCDKKLKVF